MFVNQSTIARRESGARLPDVAIITRLVRCPGADAYTLFHLVEQSGESPSIIIEDDSRVILSEDMAVPEEATEYAKMNPIAIAFMDIELEPDNGLDLSRTLFDINPRASIVFVTACVDCSVDAWKTMASGFILKPLTLESVREQPDKLRFPLKAGTAGRRAREQLE